MLFRVQPTDQVIGLRESRVQFYCGEKIALGVLQITLIEREFSKFGVCPERPGIKRQSLLKHRRSLIVLTEPRQQSAVIRIGLDILRVWVGRPQFDGLLVCIHRLGEFPHSSKQSPRFSRDFTFLGFSFKQARN